MKICKKCLRTTPLSEFGEQKDTKDGLRSWCKSCFNLNSAEWRIENHERAKELVRNWHKTNVDFQYRRSAGLKQRYGITQEYFDRMMQEQDGKCDVCKKDFIKVARVDHCHKTDKVRGLLCDRCNIILAHHENLKDNPDLVERLEKYLQKGRM